MPAGGTCLCNAAIFLCRCFGNRCPILVSKGRDSAAVLGGVACFTMDGFAAGGGAGGRNVYGILRVPLMFRLLRRIYFIDLRNKLIFCLRP